MTLEAGYDFKVLNVSMIPNIAAATTRRRQAGTVVASRHTQVRVVRIMAVWLAQAAGSVAPQGDASP